MINRVVLVGRLVRDPELRKTNSGTSVASFTVAIDNWRGQNSEKSTSFIPCTVWNQAAENLYKFTKKGSLIGVDGRLVQRSYESKDGRKVSVIEVVADSVQFLERKSSSQGRNDNNSGYSEDAPANDREDTNVDSIDIVEDDLPF